MMAVRIAGLPTLSRSSVRTSSPTVNSRTTTPISAMTSAVSPGDDEAERVGPHDEPAEQLADDAGLAEPAHDLLAQLGAEQEDEQAGHGLGDLLAAPGAEARQDAGDGQPAAASALGTRRAKAASACCPAGEAAPIRPRDRYHSARSCRMLMLCMMPRPIAMVTSDAPPLLMKGSGMPVTGMIPMTIPTFTNTWNRSMEARPAPNSVPNGSRERQAHARMRHSSAANSRNTMSAPRNPSSWARTANTKSLSWTGRNRRARARGGFLPVQESDFVFAVLAQELGFLGTLVVFLLFTALLWRILVCAWRSRDPFGTLFGAGLASAILFQVFVNVGMVIGITPVTGIPLPFISHGGASLISLAIGLGVIQSINLRQHRAEW